MIDTIGIRIHNIQRYQAVYEQFYVTNRKKNIIVEGFTTVDDDGVVQEKERSWQRSIFYADSGKHLPVNFSSSMFAPSFHYTIRVRFVHKTFDEVSMEIEFSLPKYYYGTNVFQLLSFPEFSSEHNYLNLMKAVRRFLSERLVQIPRDSDIQIYRIDFCYNQFFQNKSEAYVYQEAQRDHAENYCRAKNMRAVRGHGYNWTILTDRYSFKCYHKGDEFRKNDINELAKNPRNKYDLVYLGAQADRILRYEITFRNSMIHYLTMYNFFESVDQRPVYVTNSNLYQYVRRAAKLGDFRKTCEAAGVKAKNGVEFFCSKIKDFYLRSVFDVSYSPVCILSGSVTFSYSVYRLLFDFFWGKVKVMQVDSRSNVPEMVKRIDDYRERLLMRKKAKMVKKGSMKAKGGINLQRLLVPALLAQNMDLRLLKDYLPRSTYFNLMRDLKNAGIPMKLVDKQIVKPSLDYQDNMAYLVPLIRDVL